MEYDINKIRTLCDRYFEGETSSQEEQILRDVLPVIEVPEDLKAVKMMFCGFGEVSRMRYRPATRPRATLGRILWGLAATAAAAAVCIGVFHKECYGYDADGNAITDPQVALEAVDYLTYLDNLETSFDIARMLTQEMDNN